MNVFQYHSKQQAWSCDVFVARFIFLLAGWDNIFMCFCLLFLLYLLGTFMCSVIKCTVILAWIPSKQRTQSKEIVLFNSRLKDSVIWSAYQSVQLECATSFSMTTTEVVHCVILRPRFECKIQLCDLICVVFASCPPRMPCRSWASWRTRCSRCWSWWRLCWSSATLSSSQIRAPTAATRVASKTRMVSSTANKMKIISVSLSFLPDFL